MVDFCDVMVMCLQLGAWLFLPLGLRVWWGFYQRYLKIVEEDYVAR